MEFKVVQEMFTMRGYIINSIQATFPRHVAATKPASLKDKDGEFTTIIAFFDIEKVNNAKIMELCSKMKESGVNHILVVYTDVVTPSASKIVESISHELCIELFSNDELQYNITKHVLQPEFEKIKAPIAFKRLYGNKGEHAAMLVTDPIARFYGYQRGDVIKISRKDGYVSYRIVK